LSAPPIRLPSGVRDFLPRAAARRVSLADRVTRVFEAWGYARIITPVFEHADVLELGLGRDARAAAIRFVEPGTGEVVALRPDITAQVARLVATRLAEHDGPVRLCYEGAVYRRGGRLADELGQREILQAGIELIDANEPAGDAEALAVAAAALAAADLPETRLDIGHVAPARYVLGAAPDADVRARLATAFAKKDRASLRAAARALPAHVATLAEALGSLYGAAEPTLARAAALAWPAEVRAALELLKAVLAAFAELADPPAPAVTVDLGERPRLRLLHGRAVRRLRERRAGCRAARRPLRRADRPLRPRRARDPASPSISRRSRRRSVRSTSLRPMRRRASRCTVRMPRPTRVRCVPRACAPSSPTRCRRRRGCAAPASMPAGTRDTGELVFADGERARAADVAGVVLQFDEGES